MPTKTQLEQATAIIREHDLKATPQRQNILAYLMSHHNHPTVEMIRDNLAKSNPNIGTATVYNALNSFVELGLVIEIQNGDGSTHYDYFAKPHFHVICTNCGRIDDVDNDDFVKYEKALRKSAADETGYLTSGSHLEIYGICPTCQKKLHLHMLDTDLTNN